MKTIKDYQNAYNNTLAEMKDVYKVDRVINCDQKAIFSQIPREFECIGNSIWSDGDIKVLVIDFKFYHKFRGEKVQYLTGYNKCSLPTNHDKGEFYDKSLNLILPLDLEQAEQLKTNYETEQQEKRDWIKFKEIDLNNKSLGESFEVGESIYWHFLECLPPIYGKGCFYCSEPVRHTKEGKSVYYKLFQQGKKYFIELNTVNR